MVSQWRCPKDFGWATRIDFATLILKASSPSWMKPIKSVRRHGFTKRKKEKSCDDQFFFVPRTVNPVSDHWVLGIGGGGGNAINNIIMSEIVKGVEFVVVSTEAQELSRSLASKRFQLGSTLGKGLGAAFIPRWVERLPSMTMRLEKITAGVMRFFWLDWEEEPHWCFPGYRTNQGSWSHAELLSPFPSVWREKTETPSRRRICVVQIHWSCCGRWKPTTHRQNNQSTTLKEAFAMADQSAFMGLQRSLRILNKLWRHIDSLIAEIQQHVDTHWAKTTFTANKGLYCMTEIFCCYRGERGAMPSEKICRHPINCVT